MSRGTKVLPAPLIPLPTSPPADEIIDLADRVRAIAESDPDRVALIHARRRPGRRLSYQRHTYGEVSKRAEALAVGLRRVGVVEGTRCSFMVPPGLDAIVVGLALWRVGAVFVGIEPHGHGLRNVQRSLRKAEPEVFIGSGLAHLGRVAYRWGRGTVATKITTGPVALPGWHSLRSLEAGGPEGEPTSAAVGPDDPSVIMFTTGSTGAPKPAVLTQRNFQALTDGILEQWGFAGRDDIVDMLTFPAFWIIGLSAGGTIVVPPMDFTHKGPGDADPELLLRTIRDCGVTSMFASPALLENLADEAARTGTPTGLQRVVAGGAEVLGPLYESVKTYLMPDGELYSDYGATEALPLSEIDGTTVLRETWSRTERGAGLCVGRPVGGVEVRIMETTDETVESMEEANLLPAGAIGEVIARSPHFSDHYYRQPGADRDNKVADASGAWQRLGDTGYLDDQGRLWVCGRRGHRVVTPAGTLYPLCSEPVINSHPSVARSALVGVDDAEGIRHAVICVELAGPVADRAALSRELLDLAARYESTRGIDRVHVLDRLPVDRRHNAKIDRPAIAAMIS